MTVKVLLIELRGVLTPDTRGGGRTGQDDQWNLTGRGRTTVGNSSRLSTGGNWVKGHRWRRASARRGDGCPGPDAPSVDPSPSAAAEGDARLRPGASRLADG